MAEITENLVKKYLDNLVVKIEINQNKNQILNKEFIQVYQLYEKKYNLSNYKNKFQEIQNALD